MPLRSDPHRLPRRNHSQEGPGFLFVATEGGRPPLAEPRSDQLAALRRRRAALRAWAGGSSVAEVCRTVAVSRASVFRGRERFAEGGRAGRIDPVRFGRPSELPAEVERVILTVRLLTYWNSKGIAAEFRRRAIWSVGHGQIDRLFARPGTHRASVPRVAGPRDERSSPNELWHIDLTGPFYVRDQHARPRTCHVIALVDDCSRFLLGIRALPTRDGERGLRFLGETVELCGVPLALMNDNGTPFVAVVRTMLSRFQRTLAELAVRQIRTQVDTPWTNGTVEAFWATLHAAVLDRRPLADLAAAERAVIEYAGYYNHRLHGELDWRTPGERFDGTPFIDRGVDHIPALAGVAQLLSDLLAAA